MVVSLLSSTRPPSVLWLVATKKMPGIKICDQLGSFKSHICRYSLMVKKYRSTATCAIHSYLPRISKHKCRLEAGSWRFFKERDVDFTKDLRCQAWTLGILVGFFFVWKKVDSWNIFWPWRIYIYTYTYLGTHFVERFVSPKCLPHIFFKEILKAKS